MGEEKDLEKELDDNFVNAKTISDLVIGKSLVMNGDKIGGVSRFMVDYDVENTVTKVTMTMVIKRDSLKIEPRRISFDTVSLKKAEPVK